MATMLNWVESHPTFISLLQWVLLLLVAWLAGLFKWLRAQTRTPHLECIAPASFCFIEELGNFQGHSNAVRASFFLHASIVNRSPDKVVINRFRLGFKCGNLRLRMRQNLLRVAYPVWPRKKLGEGYKLMSVFFTEYGDENDKRLSVSGLIEPKEIASGYLLFVSTTYGSWNPCIEKNHIKIKLNLTLSSGKKLYDKAHIRVVTTPDIAEDFVPGILKHVANESGIKKYKKNINRVRLEFTLVCTNLGKI